MVANRDGSLSMKIYGERGGTRSQYHRVRTEVNVNPGVRTYSSSFILQSRDPTAQKTEDRNNQLLVNEMSQNHRETEPQRHCSRFHVLTKLLLYNKLLRDTF